MHIVQDKRTVVFCASVKHAEQIAESFCEAGIRVRRHEAIPAQRIPRQVCESRNSVLCACDLLHEGWGCPETEVLFMACPIL